MTSTAMHPYSDNGAATSATPVEAKENGQWVSLGAASLLLGMNKATLRQWGDRGLIRSFRTPGGHRRFSRDDLARLVEGPAFPRRDGNLQAGSSSALQKIRRRLHRSGPEAFPWQAKLDEEGRERLRLFGRRLLELGTRRAAQPRSRPELMAEVRSLGEEYGRELAQRGVPLEEAIQGYLFFRNSYLDAVAQDRDHQGRPPWEGTRLWRQASTLLDAVLVAMITGYKENAEAVTP
ncbi:MAG: MerR family transcriptional regulator [Dehalococcoidia bacterium]|nr:MerR family transcriptional regulator [Dehalococcoidia bacterium]